jgi:predicted O-linked N-acetylglucosamine transferase (SPINDLY family)
MGDDKDLLQNALSLLSAGQPARAAGIYRQILDRDPDNFSALHYLGVIEAGAGRLEQARSLIARSLAIQPPNIQFIENYAAVLFQAGDFEAALAACRQGLQLNDANASLLYVSAASLAKLKRLEESLVQFDRVLLLQPGHIAANNERSSVLALMRKYDDALAGVENIIAIEPRYAEAHLNKGNICTKLKRWAEAGAAYDKALELRPGLSDAWLGRGNVLRHFKRYEEALGAYDRALALAPRMAGAWNGRGNVLSELGRDEEALAAYDKALAIEPDMVSAWIGRGNVLNRFKRYREAAAAFARVLELDNAYPFAKGKLLHQKMLCCDWSNVDDLTAEIDRDVFSGQLSAEPFGWQGMATSERSLQLCAQLFNRDNFPQQDGGFAARPPASHDRIRVGYCSGEFRNQATSSLLAGVLEHHDGSRFEVYAVDNGWDDRSELRSRVVSSVKAVLDIRPLDDAQAAAAVRDSGIDILIDLNGYFGESRTNVFAQRPAPIQVSYLGFPGTLGAAYMDYIIADRHVVPAESRAFYDEKVVWLPDCYQPNDRKKTLGTRDFDRRECGLPEKGFVFCCFNNNYKITPATFDVWMRILLRVEGSVLWLLEDNAEAADYLRKEAAARGVAPERVVFAERLPFDAHEGRHRLADLFVDTLPYNAHTTGSDALWAGLPLLTQTGTTFPGRVATSLLAAVGLPELVTSTPRAYEDLAVELAGNPERLAAIRRRLADNRLTTPLFDTQSYTRHIEAAFAAMYERYRAGLPPDHIDVPRQ